MQEYKNKSFVGRAWTAASFARVNGQGLSLWTWTAASFARVNGQGLRCRTWTATSFAGIKAQSASCWRMDSNILCKIIRTWH